MSDHLSRLTILEYLEQEVSIDRDVVEAHLADCTGCREVLLDLHELIELVKDGAIFRHADDDTSEREYDALFAELEAEDARTAQDAAAANALFTELGEQPIETWKRVIAQRPAAYTAALVHRLVQEAGPELDRNAERALALLQIAEIVASALYDAESRRCLGDVYKQRGNALRVLGRYEAAIDAAILAEKFYASLPEPDAAFQVGQARYTLATVLFVMTRYAAALDALARARTLLQDYGTSAPYAKAMMLDALIRIQQGDIATARETLRQLLPIEQQLEQPLEVARVRLNLAECNLRLGDLEPAMSDAIAAGDAFRVLGNVAEETRSEWTKAMIRLASGEADAALARLYEVAAVFRELHMSGDAGFVELDIAEELLRRQEWSDAERIARDLVSVFTTAGVTLAAVNAIDFLRRAVESREATTDVVRYIREYVAADDPVRPFEPPITLAN
jgi:tetratricopeptide (TPR) repeat protein